MSKSVYILPGFLTLPALAGFFGLHSKMLPFDSIFFVPLIFVVLFWFFVKWIIFKSPRYNDQVAKSKQLKYFTIAYMISIPLALVIFFLTLLNGFHSSFLGAW